MKKKVVLPSSKPSTDPKLCRVKSVDEKKIERVQQQMEKEKQISLMADVFSAFSEPARLKIMMALRHDECCVCELSRITGLSPSATSHQLRILRSLRLVQYRRSGQQAIYSLDDQHIGELLSIMSDHLRERR